MKRKFKTLIIGSLLVVLLVGGIITNSPTPKPYSDPPGTGSINLTYYA